MDERYKKLGMVKPKDLDRDFDKIYEEYKNKAVEAGCHGALKFVKERGKIIIYVVI